MIAISKEERWSTAAVGFAAMVLYLMTMYPDVSGGDSGELIAASVSRGVPHPPGYPLYALLGRLFSLIPHGTLAWRFNLLSVVCGAGAAAILCFVVVRWTRSPWAGIAAGSLFAFAPGTWCYAISAEVFALDNLACVSLMGCALLFHVRRDPRWAWAGALGFGLGMSNHHTVLFTGVPLAVWTLWAWRNDPRRRTNIRRAAVFFVVGLLPYLYLGLGTNMHAPVSWGRTHGLTGLFAHVLRSDYGTFRLAPIGVAAAGSPLDTMRAFLEDVVGQLGAGGLLLATVGLVGSLRERHDRAVALVALVPPLLGVLVIVALANLPAREPLHRAVLARFWQQPEIYACVFSAWGVVTVARTKLAPIAPVVGSAVALLQPTLHFSEMDHHDDRTARSYGAEILRIAPKRALVLTRGDLITNTTRYLQVAEGMRTDVRVVDEELLGFAWERERLLALAPEVVVPEGRYMPGAPDGYAIKSLVDANVAHMPMFVCGGHKPGDLSWALAYRERPLGMCASIRPLGSAIDDAEDARWLDESAAALPHIEGAERARKIGSWEAVAVHDHWAARYLRALELMDLAGRDPMRRPLLEAAALTLDEIAQHDPAPTPDTYKLLAQAIGRLGLDSREQRARAASAWRRYVHAAPSSDPQLPAIQAELARLEGLAEPR